MCIWLTFTSIGVSALFEGTCFSLLIYCDIWCFDVQIKCGLPILQTRAWMSCIIVHVARITAIIKTFQSRGRKIIELVTESGVS